MLTRWKIRRIIKKLKFMQTNRVNNQPTDEMLKKEIAYYFELAAIYKKLKGHKNYPYAHVMQEECLRAATGIDDAEADYQLGKMLIEEARFRGTLEKEGLFNSEANDKKCQQLYVEAHAYLSAAMTLNHIQAKRLKGLCYINGWGLDADKKAGFELVVASIDQEGSWDRVPQLFASMGLNKPEFFSAITQRRKTS